MCQKVLEVLNDLLKKDQDSIEDLIHCPTHSGTGFLDVLNEIMKAHGEKPIAYYHDRRGYRFVSANEATRGDDESGS